MLIMPRSAAKLKVVRHGSERITHFAHCREDVAFPDAEFGRPVLQLGSITWVDFYVIRTTYNVPFFHAGYLSFSRRLEDDAFPPIPARAADSARLEAFNPCLFLINSPPGSSSHHCRGCRIGTIGQRAYLHATRWRGEQQPGVYPEHGFGTQRIAASPLPAAPRPHLPRRSVTHEHDDMVRNYRQSLKYLHAVGDFATVNHRQPCISTGLSRLVGVKFKDNPTQKCVDLSVLPDQVPGNQ